MCLRNWYDHTITLLSFRTVPNEEETTRQTCIAASPKQPERGNRSRKIITTSLLPRGTSNWSTPFIRVDLPEVVITSGTRGWHTCKVGFYWLIIIMSESEQKDEATAPVVEGSTGISDSVDKERAGTVSSREKRRLEQNRIRAREARLASALRLISHSIVFRSPLFLKLSFNIPLFKIISAWFYGSPGSGTRWVHSSDLLLKSMYFELNSIAISLTSNILNIWYQLWV